MGGGVTFLCTHDMTNIMDNTWKESNKGRLGDESRLGLPHITRICSLKFHEEGRRKWRSPSNVNMSHVLCDCGVTDRQDMANDMGMLKGSEDKNCELLDQCTHHQGCYSENINL